MHFKFKTPRPNTFIALGAALMVYGWLKDKDH